MEQPFYSHFDDCTRAYRQRAIPQGIYQPENLQRPGNFGGAISRARLKAPRGVNVVEMHLGHNLSPNGRNGMWSS